MAAVQKTDLVRHDQRHSLVVSVDQMYQTNSHCSELDTPADKHVGLRNSADLVRDLCHSGSYWTILGMIAHNSV